MVEFVFRPPPGRSGPCLWTGEYFVVDGEKCSVLAYGRGESGWTEGLTKFHEETAGSDHYIDVASRENAVQYLQGRLSASAPIVMEVGCSSGLLLQLLQERLPHIFLIGADYLRGPLEALSRRMPGIPLLQFDLVSCPLPDASLDAVVALNVLEPIEDDRAAMRQIHRILKPGGLALIEAPRARTSTISTIESSFTFAGIVCLV
jgi:SAM-dependent methyltransferase